MSSARKPMIYLGVFFVLALFYYFYEHKGGIERAESEQQASKALQFSPDSAAAISITGSSGIITLECLEDGWELVNPVAAAADSEAVARLLGSVSSAVHDRVVEDSAADLSIFGLENPQLVFSVTPISSGIPQVLQLGNKNPGETFIYASNSRNPGRVVLLNSWLLGDLDRTVFQLRDKSLFQFQKDEVERLTVKVLDSRDIEITRNGDHWDVRSGATFRADRDSVDAILDMLADTETEGFIDQLPPQWETTYQLDQPALTLQLYMEDGSSCGMQFGARDTSGHYYAVRQDEKDNVYIAGAELFDLLCANPSRLRDMAPDGDGNEDIKSTEN
jgi:hypothetical protein